MKYAQRNGFSIIELLVVICIVILLLGILLPTLSNVRKSARSTACLANLQQWGYSYQMYVTSNHGMTLSEAERYVPALRWWQWLAPFNGNVRVTLLCPEAREPQSIRPHRLDDGEKYASGAVFSAWLVTGPLGDDAGSYGFNRWLYRAGNPKNPNPYIHFPAKEPARIPVLGDCCWPWTIAIGGDGVPTSFTGDPEPSPGLDAYCIDRHRMAVNIVFLDGHGEHVPLAELWKLKWCERSVPRNVVIPGS